MKKKKKLLISKEQDHKCFFCGLDVPIEEQSIEHLVAQANGGGHDHWNLVMCCKTANQKLADLSLKEKLHLLLTTPKGELCKKVEKQKKVFDYDEFKIRFIEMEHPKKVIQLLKIIEEEVKHCKKMTPGEVILLLEQDGILKVDGNKIEYINF